jgi:DNA-binding MarR family transcriptional regulator
MTTKNVESLHALLRLIGVVRKVDPEMPAQSLNTLLVVAQEPGIHQWDLARKLAVSPSAAARIALRLGDQTVMGKKGLGLLHVETDEADRRQRLLWLTPKGQAFLKATSDALLLKE